MINPLCDFDDGSQDDVLIALEIVNGDKDFYGKHNLIPVGSTFYLVGKLEVNGKEFTKAHTTGDYRITKEPATGTGNKTEASNYIRAFVQDYKTIANITLTKTSLQNAYSTIPDLRSTETVFGLSVDLNWEAGLTFTVNM